MHIPPQCWRLAVLFLPYFTATFFSGWGIKQRLITNGLCLVMFALLLIPRARKNLRAIHGKLELLGVTTLAINYGLTLFLIWLNGSEYLGVLFGGLLGFVNLGAFGLCLAGGIWGIVNARQAAKASNTRPGTDRADG